MGDISSLTKEEVEKEIKILEKKGFRFLQNWSLEFRVPDRYKLPSGRILEEDELLNFFDKTKPEFGNKKHLEIQEAIHYYHLINSEVYDEERRDYFSFLDVIDESEARRKYNP